MIVVDASVLLPALADDGITGEKVRARLVEDELAAPELIDLEILSVLRRLVAADRLRLLRARQAVAALESLPLARHPHRPLLRGVWALRDNVTAYDAAYVALAAALDATLLTADVRLAGAPRLPCQIEVLTSGGKQADAEADQADGK